MTIEFKDGALVCAGALSVEDAETLLQLLLDQRAGDTPLAADLSACSHVHGACLQVLMAAPVAVAHWPQDPALAQWLRAALY